MNSIEQRAKTWVPLFGEFDSPDNSVVFHGKPAPQATMPDPPSSESAAQSAFGIALSDISMADGVLRAEVEFESVDESSVCELALAYDANARHLIAAGLGGDRASFFCIREFGGPNKEGNWNWHQARGDRANLKSGRVYALSAEFRGSDVTFSIDGVPIASATATTPVGRPRQAGLFCKGFHKITVRDFRAEIVKPRAFAIMQFTPEYDDVYQDVVKEICGGYQLNVIRADEVTGPGFVISDIVNQISSAQLIIADISPENPNVYFEVGYALALSKPTILLARKGTPLPFDVRGFRVLFYEDSIGGKKKLEQGLREHIAAILRS